MSMIPLANEQEVQFFVNVILTAFAREDGMECGRILLSFSSTFR